ncbi:MAG: hypothetical protein IMW91_08000 [Firmicutes bacterium]|nr:hypothetical protein [Bacillota bacterium]
MILYTPLSPQVIFKDHSSRVFRWTRIKGVPALLEQEGKERWVLVEIHSVNLSDYLDPQLQPGRILKSSEVYE